MPIETKYTYQLRFKEDAEGSGTRMTYDKGELFREDHTQRDTFTENEIRGFFSRKEVFNRHGFTADIYLFPESFDIIETKQEISVETTEAEADPDELAIRLNVPNYRPGTYS